jgi:hypothetical protein
VAIGKNGSGVALVLRREVTLTWTWLQSHVLSRRRRGESSRDLMKGSSHRNVTTEAKNCLPCSLQKCG